MMQRITDLDFQILLWIQQNIRGEDATDFWESMTDLGNMGAIWIAIALALFIYRRTRLCGATAMLAIVINTVVANVILKNWVARPRPFLAHPELHPLIHLPTDFSFPSGHTSCAFAVAFVIYALLPKRYSIPRAARSRFCRALPPVPWRPLPDRRPRRRAHRLWRCEACHLVRPALHKAMAARFLILLCVKK